MPSIRMSFNDLTSISIKKWYRRILLSKELMDTYIQEITAPHELLDLSAAGSNTKDRLTTFALNL